MKVIKKESAKAENKNIIELPEEVSIELEDRTIFLEKGERIEIMDKVEEREKFNFKVFGTAPMPTGDGQEHLLGTIVSKGNAVIFANAMERSYDNVRIQ